MSDVVLRDPRLRRPVAVSLGPHWEGVAMPHPDCWDTLTAQAGVVKRLAFRPPPPNKNLLKLFRVFCRRWAKNKLVPLQATEDTTVEAWLASTNYPEWRKADLRKKWAKIEKMTNLKKMHTVVKSFMKDEFYGEWKHGRGINSRTDEFKCAVGPIFKLIEKAVFKNKHFIKFVPVAMRPHVIAARLFRVGQKFVTTDYSSFESLFTSEMMEACEFELYGWMTQNLPEGDLFMKLVRQVLGGKNQCHWKDFIVEVLATRMSGEMCTSLGNGFSNLMLALFLAIVADHLGPDPTDQQVDDWASGILLLPEDDELMKVLDPDDEVDGFVEGDDGVFSFAGNIPATPLYSKLGMVVKLEVHENLSTASFCGIVFDERDQRNLTDPLEVLAKFGYANNRYLRVGQKKSLMLLRCKALSLAHQYPGSPIIQSLAFYGLRVSAPVQHYVKGWVQRGGPAGISMWERDQLIKAIEEQDSIRPAEIGYGSRTLVEKLWRIPPHVQMAVESTLDAKCDLLPLNLPDLAAHVPHAWTKMWDAYSVKDDVFSDKIFEPQLPVGVLPGLAVEWVLS